MRYRIYYFDKGNLLLYDSHRYGIDAYHDNIKSAQIGLERASGLTDHQLILVDIDTNSIIGFVVKGSVRLI